MRKVVEKYNSISLILRIVCGLVIGTLLGLLIPQASGVGVLGTLFVGALKAIAPILVFALIIASLSQSGKGIGKQFRGVVMLYILNTFLAALLAVVFSFLFPVTIKLTEAAEEQVAPGGILEVLQTLLNNLVANPIYSLATANYLGILFWSIVIGLALRSIVNEGLKRGLTHISDAVSQIVR